MVGETIGNLILQQIKPHLKSGPGILNFSEQDELAINGIFAQLVDPKKYASLLAKTYPCFFACWNRVEDPRRQNFIASAGNKIVEELTQLEIMSQPNFFKENNQQNVKEIFRQALIEVNLKDILSEPQVLSHELKAPLLTNGA